jgi:hydrogenase expression/formation protein HypD
VVFFSVGFETTAPATALAVHQAKMQNVKNFSLLVAHVLVPPAIEAILSMSGTAVQGFLAAGHVCTVTGYEEYYPLVEKYKAPIVVTGFEPVDLLKGILKIVQLLESGENRVENQYSRVVKPEGNKPARELLSKVFSVTDRKWRGIGSIPNSGWRLSDEYSDYDAENRFDVSHIHAEEPEECMSGQVLQGILSPPDCPEFGKTCTPEHPLGATMVSSEGACAAYYRYRINR